MSALDERTKAERALKDLQKAQDEQQVLVQVWFAFINPYLPYFKFTFHFIYLMFTVFNFFYSYINTLSVICFYLLTWA